MEKVKIGLIGCGAPHAHNSHLPQLTSFKDVSVDALCDIDQQKLDQAMEKYQVKYGYTDYKKMLEEVELDAVFVIVRPSLLKEIVIDCFKHNLPVSIEKAPGKTPDETAAMLQAANRYKCLNMVGFDRRYSPVVLKATEIMNTISSPKQIVGHFYRQYCSSIDMFDAYIHGLDLMRFLGGDIEDFSMNYHRSGEILDGCDLLISYQNGTVGNLKLLSCAGMNHELYEIHAHSTSILVDHMNGALKVMKAGKETFYTIDDLSTDPIEATKGYWENRHFIDCVATGKMPRPNLDDSLKTMKFAQEIANKSIGQPT